MIKRIVKKEPERAFRNAKKEELSDNGSSLYHIHPVFGRLLNFTDIFPVLSLIVITA